MEDYQSAFLQRHQDTEILHQSKRKIAAMHFGGITIECLLKSMILGLFVTLYAKLTDKMPRQHTSNPKIPKVSKAIGSPFY